MPRLRQVSRQDTTDELVLRMYDQLFGDRDPVAEPGTATGTPGDWWTVFALVPDVFRHAVQGFGVYRSPDRFLDPVLRELGQTRAGWARGSQFVYSQHCKSCRALGMSEEMIEAIPSWGTSDLFSPVQRAVLARELGAFNDAPVTDIEVERGRAVAVVTPLGRVACETVVNAAGPWAALIGDMAGVSLPITPVRRQMLTTTPLPDLAPDFPFVIDFARSLYFHREGEGLLTGMSNPHQTPGFDESVDAEWELTHLEAAVERLPLLAHAGLLGHWAGLYEVTPDAHPIIGRMPELENFVVVAGFSGHGFMHGPIAGLLVSEIILDGGAHTLDITELGYERFDRGQHHREYNVI